MGSSFIKQIQARAYMRDRFFRMLFNKGIFDCAGMMPLDYFPSIVVYPDLYNIIPMA